MRVLIDGAPPYAQSGYGRLCHFVSRALVSLGHQVAVSCYAGVHEERVRDGVQLLGTGGRPYGNGVTALNYRRWNADAMLILQDLFVLDPDQFRGLTVFPWVPVDCDPLGVMDRRWLDTVGKIADLRPIAMSEHAKKMMAGAGIESVHIPMATDMVPDPAAGIAWRAAKGIPPDMFLIVKLGVNNEDDRKAFSVTEQAFAAFIKGNRNQSLKNGLYLHCEAQARKSPNLAYMAVDLGLKDHIAFCDEEMRACDLYDEDYLHGMFCAADVTDMATKGEGFGVPVIQSLACGTPVIGCRNSAVTEKIRPEWGWLIGGQREWAVHHNAWWKTPSVLELAGAYQKARTSARTMRRAAARAGAQWSEQAMTGALARILT
jgi:hypothetical protein